MPDADEGFPTSKRVIITDEPPVRVVEAPPLPPGIPETLTRLNGAVKAAAQRAGVEPKTVVFDAGTPDSPLPNTDVYLNSQTAITPKLMEILTPEELTAVTVFDAIYNQVLYKRGGHPEDLLDKNATDMTGLEIFGTVIKLGGGFVGGLFGVVALAEALGPVPTAGTPTADVQMTRRSAMGGMLGIAGTAALAAMGGRHLEQRAENQRLAANEKAWEPLHRQAQIEALKCCDEPALRSANAKMEAWAKDHKAALSNWVSDIKSAVAAKNGPART